MKAKDDHRPTSGMRISLKPGNKTRVLVAMFFAVIFGAFGEISLSKGMKTVGGEEFPSMFSAMIAAVTNIHVISGVVLLLVFMLLYLASLSWEDLTYVVPLTAGVYILVTILAYFLLHENVSPLRWTGSFLVATGIVLVART